MKPVLFSTLLLFVLACPAPKTPKTDANIRQISLPSETSPFVSFRVAFLTGSIDDPEGKEGLSSLSAHLFVEGGTQKLSYPEILQKLYPMSAELSVNVGKELTVFSGRVHKDLLEDFYEIFRQILVSPSLKQSDLDRLRDQALAKLTFGLKQNDDESLGKAALEAMIYEGHPYAHPVLGKEASLRAITLEDVKSYARNFFTQDRLLIGLAGAYPKNFLQKVAEDLQALPQKGAEKKALPPAPQHESPRVWIIEKETASTALSFGYPIKITRSDNAFAPLDIARSYLGEHRQSHGVLFDTIREKRGLNYGDYAYIEAFEQAGFGRLPKTNVPRKQQFFSIWIRPVQPEHAVFVTKQAKRELEKFLQDGLSQQRFEATRSFMTGYTRLFEETEERRLGYAIDDRFYELQDAHLQSMRNQWKLLSVQDVNQAIQKHLAPPSSSMQFAFVTKDAKKLKEELLSSQLTTIEYASPKDAKILEEDKIIGAYQLKFQPEDIEIIPIKELFAR